MKKTISNLIYQIIFQATKIILPFITIPIVSKSLGPEGLGTYNYINSIAQYFVLFAGLGIGVYGNRQIAINRESKLKLSQTFFELFTLSFSISMVSLVCYFIIASFSDNRVYFYYQSLIIIAAVFDISWFFMGIEDFKKTSLSSLATQLLSFVLIVLFVKSPDSLGIYIFIQSISILLSQLIMWGFVWRYLEFVSINMKDILRHFVPALTYFTPKIAIVLYSNLNKTLLGLLDSKEAVGFYSNTLILNSVIVTLVTTVDLVLLPKMSNLFSKGRSKEIINTLNQSIHVQIFFTIPIMFGIILVTPTVVPWFFGNSFLMLKDTIPFVSPLVIIIPLGMAVGRQYLIPMNRMKVYNIAVILGALVSIILNLSLIPFIGLYGAIIATLVAESFVTVVRIRALLKETAFEFKYSLISKYFLSAIIMYIVTNVVTRQLQNNLFSTIIQIIIGGSTYMIITMVLKSNPIFNIVKKRGGI